jgi:hypothetical protein
LAAGFNQPAKTISGRGQLGVHLFFVLVSRFHQLKAESPFGPHGIVGIRPLNLDLTKKKLSAMIFLTRRFRTIL